LRGYDKLSKGVGDIRDREEVKVTADIEARHTWYSIDKLGISQQGVECIFDRSLVTYNSAMPMD
jgi:hypothetical protein